MSKILIIEDEENLRFTLGERLRLEGYEVELAEDGEIGLEKARKNPPDLVLCDIMMPKMDGYKVVELLRQEEHLADLPVIMLTALNQPQQLREGMNVGADDFLVKPVNKEDLLKSITTRLSKSTQKKVITEKRMEMVLQSLAGMIHDLRSPLAALLGATEMMHGEKKEADVPREDLDAMLSAVERADQQVQNILGFAKARFNKLPCQPLRLAVNKICDRIIRDLPERHRIIFQGPTSPCEIMADPVHLQNIITNLLSNALKYSPPKKPVTLTLENNPPEVSITVSDLGIGILERDLPNLFEPFFRAGNARNKEGNGLGLAMVKHLVEMAGGKIVVRTQAGKGSDFIVTWPLAADAAMAKGNTLLGGEEEGEVAGEVMVKGGESRGAFFSKEKTSPVGGATQHGLLQILILDDELLTRNAMARMLIGMPEVGITATASTLAEARKRIGNLHFDLAFLDVHLPDGLGFELAAELPAETRVVFASAYDGYAAKAFDYSPMGYLLKPVRLPQLQQVLKKLLSGTAGGNLSRRESEYDARKILLPSNSGKELVSLSQISQVKAYGEYSVVVLTTGKTAMVRKSLSTWAKELPTTDFLRVHRNSIINFHYIESIKQCANSQLQIHLRHSDEQITASVRMAPQLRKALKTGIASQLEGEKTADGGEGEK
jgi:signal transduction histidine kinase